MDESFGLVSQLVDSTRNIKDASAASLIAKNEHSIARWRVKTKRMLGETH